MSAGAGDWDNGMNEGNCPDVQSKRGDYSRCSLQSLSCLRVSSESLLELGFGVEL